MTEAMSGIYNADERRVAWSKGMIVPGEDPAVYRKDRYGYWIKYDQFRTNANLAWDVEYRSSSVTGDGGIYPISKYHQKEMINY